MTSQPLPERPNLEQLKKQAKSLLHSAQANDSDALRRFRALPAFAAKTDAELGTLGLALHDAQSVIAREHGFPSWNSLREQVEERTLTFALAVDEFVRSATDGGSGRATRLLSLHPGIARANLQTALVLGDLETVEKCLKDHPERAHQPGGVKNWEPLLYVCHNCLHREVPGRADRLVAITRRLLALGANPNAIYHWRWHPELPRTALWGALCVIGHAPLAEALLEAGANPTDGVSMHINAGGGNLPALELLHRHGAAVNGIPGGVPPLVYILGWANNPRGAHWLLEHGADANLPWGSQNESPLHVAARRWDVPMVEALVRHDADIQRRRADGRTPHAVAALHGNHAIADWLLTHGARDELAPVDRFAAACARGDGVGAENLLQSDPGLKTALSPEHHLMLHVAAERGNATALGLMLANGFDPHATDNERVTALHRAAMAGQPDCVRLLLAHGARADAIDGMFDAPPLIWAVEGFSNGKHAGADYVAVARLLLAAAPDVEWKPGDDTPGQEGALEKLAELRRAALQS